MSIQKEDLLALAGELSNGPTEAHWRSAVSRAYYATYHGTKDWYATLTMPGSNAGQNGGVHQQFINALKNPAPGIAADLCRKSKTLGARLDVLRIQRTTADYALQETVDKVLAASSCALAADILAKL